MKRVLTLSMLAAIGAAANAQTFTGGGGTILDNADATSTITAAGGGLVVGSFDRLLIGGLTHSWVGDLTVTLTKVGGITVEIFVRPGFEGAGFGQSDDLSGIYTFTDGAAETMWVASFNAAGVVPAGDYKPAGMWLGPTSGSGAELEPSALSEFVGTAITGDWTLTITDSAGGDTGAWTDWAFTVTPVPEPATLLAIGAGIALLAARRRK